MNSAIRARREAEDGFTLIELLVVVIIIGILAAIAIPAFLNQRERAWQAELSSTVRNVALEAEAAATASGGNYSDALGTVEADILTALDVFLNDLQASTTIPVDLTAAAADTNSFAFCGTHASITVDNSVSYDSDAGGLGDYTEAACAAGSLSP